CIGGRLRSGREVAVDTARGTSAIRMRVFVGANRERLRVAVDADEVGVGKENALVTVDREPIELAVSRRDPEPLGLADGVRWYEEGRCRAGEEGVGLLGHA